MKSRRGCSDAYTGTVTISEAATIYNGLGKRVISIDAGATVDLEPGIYIVHYRNGDAEKLIVK